MSPLQKLNVHEVGKSQNDKQYILSYNIYNQLKHCKRKIYKYFMKQTRVI